MKKLIKLFCAPILIFVLGIIVCQDVVAQQYNVIESTMAYKHVNQDSIEIKTRDILFDSDLVSINNKLDSKGQQIIVTGSLGISLPTGEIRRTYGEYKKQTLENLFFPPFYTLLKNKAIDFFKGLLSLETKDETKSAVHYQGQIDYIDGLKVSFVYDSIPYMIDSIPVDSTFDIHLVNNTDSVLSIAISCRCKSAYNTPFESYIIHKKPNEEPIVLVPGESILIPSPFVRKENYFVYHINIYGSPHFFVLQDKPDDERYFITNTENEFDLSTVKRYYYVTNEK